MICPNCQATGTIGINGECAFCYFNIFNSKSIPLPSPSFPQSVGKSIQFFNDFSVQIPDGTVPKPEIPSETRTEPLVGYRAWKLKLENGKYYLQSTYKPTLWPHREKLVRGEKQAPEQVFDPSLPSVVLGDPNDFSKGIHAIKERWKLGQLCVNYQDARVAGEVFLWGEVTETEFGYLAQYAYPKQLWVMDDMDPTVVMALEDSYGCPVHVSEMLTDCFKATKEAELRIDALKGSNESCLPIFIWLSIRKI